MVIQYVIHHECTENNFRIIIDEAHNNIKFQIKYNILTHQQNKLTSSKCVSLKCFFPISVRLTLSKALPSVSTNLEKKAEQGELGPIPAGNVKFENQF